MRIYPTDIILHQTSCQLEIAFEDGAHFHLPYEYLRVCSPSAEVQGHSRDSAVLVVGKEHVHITGIEPVGQYAVQLIFDDGHNSGLYSWDVLYDLGHRYKEHWADYQRRLAEAELLSTASTH